MVLYVLDTSVAIAWYLPESTQVEARAWQQKLFDRRLSLVVPGLHYWEFGNVLRTQVRRGRLDEPTARDIYALHLDAPLEVYEPDCSDLIDTAFAYDATFYDAVYITISLKLDAPLLTAERPTTPWVTRLGWRAETIASAPAQPETRAAPR
jgi:predicted nucleic acid-binding protein